MASAIATNIMRTTHKVVTEKLVGTAGTNTSIWYPMRDFANLLAVGALAVKAGNGMTKFEIIAGTSAAGAGATTVKDSGAIVADSSGTSGSVAPDQVVLEMTADELNALGNTESKVFTHIAVRATNHNVGDVVAATLVFSGARNQVDGLTPAASIAS